MTRDEIQRQMAEFERRGGKVTRCPPGASAYGKDRGIRRTQDECRRLVKQRYRRTASRPDKEK